MSLQQRKITVTIKLGQGTFGEGTTNDVVTLTGFRVQADIVKAGLPGLDSANIRIYGVDKSIMNKITRIGVPYYQVRNNQIAIEAGDDIAGMSQVFYGTIFNSFGDMNGLPESAVEIVAATGLLGLVKPTAPLSYPDGADVATIMRQIATSMGLNFQNNGVNVRLPSCYFPGTAIDQMRAVASAANINAAFGHFGSEPDSYIEIWPIDGMRGGSVPKIGPSSGLVGYPQYSDLGISITTLFNPGLSFGGAFELDTSIVPAVGTWNVLQLGYQLESETPGGAWFNHIVGRRPNANGSPEFA